MAHIPNVYSDDFRAETYAALEFTNTYYLAYRDFPLLFRKFVTGSRALDFGCGTGRSTRFLKTLGFDATGIDTSEQMIGYARKLDPSGRYILIEEGDFSALNHRKFDLILSVFTFDNIPGEEHRAALMRGLGDLLSDRGVLILLDSTPELYVHEWASFSTRDFPENHLARSGEVVKDIITDIDDHRPVLDILWRDEDYRCCFRQAGLELLHTHHPLATGEESYHWVNETVIPPWVVYVTSRKPTHHNPLFVSKSQNKIENQRYQHASNHHRKQP